MSGHAALPIGGLAAGSSPGGGWCGSQVSCPRGGGGGSPSPDSHADGFQQLQHGGPRHCRGLGRLGWTVAGWSSSASSPSH